MGGASPVYGASSQSIAGGTELITRQRKLRAALDAKEVDKDAIQILLVGLESLLMLRLQERERLRADLASLDGSTPKTT
jgi:hypothetical protein